jgi:hypothetical protein
MATGGQGIVKARLAESQGLTPNALRFCCGGLRRPPAAQPNIPPAAGRRVQDPASSKRGLGRRAQM